MHFLFGDDAQAQAALLALGHEEDLKKRSVSRISRKANELLITVESTDVVALRASLNAYLRDIQVAEGIDGKFENGED